MDIKRVVATFILTGFLFAGSNYYYTNEINEKQYEIEELEKSQGLRDSEIAKLEDTVKSKDKTIKEQDVKLNMNIKKVEKQKKIIELQKKLIDEQKRLMDLRKQELETLREVKSKSVNFNDDKKGSDVQGGRKLNMQVTAYGADCNGCTGITATGVDVRNTTTYQGMRIIATDPNIIPMYSIVRIDLKSGGSFTAISLDTGGAIKGHIVDYLVGSERESVNFGRQNATVTVLREGK